MDVVFVILQEVSELLFISVNDRHHDFPHLRGKVHSLADLHVDVIVKLDVDFVNVSQFQLCDPGAEEDTLRGVAFAEEFFLLLLHARVLLVRSRGKFIERGNAVLQ